VTRRSLVVAAATASLLVASLLLGHSSANALRLPSAPACTIFPASNAWNQRVDSLPVAADSAQLIGSIGLTTGLHPDFGSGLYDGSPIGIPFDVVSKSTTRSRVTFDYADESDKGPYPIPKTVHIEGGRTSDGDRHALLVDRSACKLYELYALYPKTGGGWKAGSGAIWNLRTNAVRPAGWTSADAAGLPIFPGLARYDEVARGTIDHALRFTAARTRARTCTPHATMRRAPTIRRCRRWGARAPQGERRHLRLSAPGAHRAPGVEDVRDDPRRQRIELVHQRRARPALVERRAALARRHQGSDFEVVDTSSLPHPGG
jgi:hypothetical protein